MLQFGEIKTMKLYEIHVLLFVRYRRVCCESRLRFMAKCHEYNNIDIIIN